MSYYNEEVMLSKKAMVKYYLLFLRKHEKSKPRLCNVCDITYMIVFLFTWESVNWEVIVLSK